jgi:hypothetical protein
LSFDPLRPSVFTPFLRRFTDEPARDLAETIALYQEVREAHRRSIWAQQDVIERVNARCLEIIRELTELPNYTPLLEVLERCQKAVIAQESTVVSFPDIDWDRAKLSMKEQVDLRRFLRAKQHFLANEDTVVDLFLRALCNLFAGILMELPTFDEDKASLTVPLISLLHKPGEAVAKTVGTVTTEPLIDAGLFTALRQSFYENMCRASGVVPYEETRRPLVYADESELKPEELVNVYLAGTPFLDLFKIPVPFVLPESTRFEHHWIVGGSGHGKTNALMNLIVDDLQRVATDKASIVVIDSQNSLIPAIAHLPYFAKGRLLDGKLVLIDATDVEYPIALNLFDVGLQRLNSYSLLDRERMLNTASEVMQFILASLLGAEMTSRQSTLFGYALQAMQVIPHATIHTFRELMEPNGRKKYAPFLAKLEGRAREFFETQFDAPIFSSTKQQVVARLFAISENRTFDRMLSNPRSKLDLFSEINVGKVILINTAKDLLKQQGTEIFGRFFLALIAQAAQERATISPSKRLPCYVYIDECQDYLSTDSNFTIILEQARKQKVGLIVAHQYLSQLSQNTLDSLYANTSIKFVGGVSDKDAYALARNMHCEPSFIADQPKGSFAGYVRNTTRNAVTLRFPYLRLEKMPRISAEDYRDVLQSIRNRYGATRAVPQLGPAPSNADSDAPQRQKPSTQSNAPPFSDDWRS